MTLCLFCPGPVGLDKMLVDQIGDVTITNDGATILKQLEVEHPAAKVLVELADLQDQEVGDGTTSFVIVAAELLRRANELVKNKVHPTTVMSGYRLAVKEAVKYIKDHLIVSVDQFGVENLVNAAKTSMSRYAGYFVCVTLFPIHSKSFLLQQDYRCRERFLREHGGRSCVVHSRGKRGR